MYRDMRLDAQLIPGENELRRVGPKGPANVDPLAPEGQGHFAAAPVYIEGEIHLGRATAGRHLDGQALAPGLRGIERFQFAKRLRRRRDLRRSGDGRTAA